MWWYVLHLICLLVCLFFFFLLLFPLSFPTPLSFLYHGPQWKLILLLWPTWNLLSGERARKSHSSEKKHCSFSFWISIIFSLLKHFSQKHYEVISASWENCKLLVCGWENLSIFSQSFQLTSKQFINFLCVYQMHSNYKKGAILV